MNLEISPTFCVCRLRRIRGGAVPCRQLQFLILAQILLLPLLLNHMCSLGFHDACVRAWGAGARGGYQTNTTFLVSSTLEGVASPELTLLPVDTSPVAAAPRRFAG